MKRLRCIALICLCLIFLNNSGWAEDFVTLSGDMLRWLLPGSGYALTFMKHDLEGRWAFYKSFSCCTASTYALKTFIHKHRPNHKPRAFPSGHTSMAFQGASFLALRYSWRWGLLAYVLAGWVGWSRLEAHKHDLLDVTAGAAIGILSTVYWVKPQKRDYAFSIVFHRGFGVTLEGYF